MVRYRYSFGRGDNSPLSILKYKLRFGIIDYPDLETLLENNTDRGTVIKNAVSDGWWPADNFDRQKDYAGFLDNETLVKHQHVDHIMRTIIKAVRKGDCNFGWSNSRYGRGSEVELRGEIQDALMATPKWTEYLFMVDYERGSKKLAENEPEIVRRAEGGGEYNLQDNIIEHLPVGHRAAEVFFRQTQKNAGRYQKNDYEKIAVKLSKKLVEEEWPKFTDLVRAFLVNREDLEEDKRLTAFRCMLRERAELEVTSKIPWDFIRNLQADLLPIVPTWLRRNLKHMSGEPVTTAEFKKLSFRVILKGTNGAKRRFGSDPKTAVEEYDKLFVDNAPAQQAAEFLGKVKDISFKAIKQWMEDCGTETAKDLAVKLMTTHLLGLSNEDQIALEARIKAEPKELLTYERIKDEPEE